MSKKLLAKYYQENKERLQKKALERYQNLSKEGKEKKQQYSYIEKKHYRMRKKMLYYNLDSLLLSKGKYKKRFPFVLILQKFYERFWREQFYLKIF